MKVCLVNTTDLMGGAAIAARRLAAVLNRKGIQTTFLVYKSQGDTAPFTQKIIHSFSDKLKYLVKVKLDERLVKKINPGAVYNFSPSQYGMDISKHPAIQEADIIHLHWINHAFLDIKALSALMRLGKPIVWTLHDMWAFTGGCHHSRGCNKYETECHACPILASHIDYDLSWKIWHQKHKYYKQKNLTIITPSAWLGDCAKSSSLLSHTPVHVIPNGIDTRVFHPINKAEARKNLGLPPDKKILAFGAVNALTNKRKGIEYLLEALQLIKSNPNLNPEDYLLCVFGVGAEENTLSFPLPAQFMGRIKDPEIMASIYSAADVFVLPSLEENLPNTIMEAMACGTPSVAFNIGGIPDEIRHRENGYLAHYKDAKDLASGILETLENSKTWGNKSVAMVKELFEEKVVAERHIRLYEGLLGK